VSVRYYLFRVGNGINSLQTPKTINKYCDSILKKIFHQLSIFQMHESSSITIQRRIRSKTNTHLIDNIVRNKSELVTMSQVGASASGAVNKQTVCTQCGDLLTVDEENIVVMVKSYSPVRSLEEQKVIIIML